MAEQPGGITYVTGDATAPIGDGPKIVVHVVNDRGLWGRGFVLAVSKRWPEPEAEYRRWFLGTGDVPDFALGAVQFVPVGDGIEVANMVGQRGIRAVCGIPPIRYFALERGLGRVARQARAAGASVHMPRIGCGLAGGTWDCVEPLIVAELCGRGVPVTVYDLP
jgi:O-acetyl-ADP-ribose deacetylase (regulator of RNase III)